MARTNTPPADPFEILMRVYDCSQKDLATRLGVDSKTITRWRKEGCGKNAAKRLQDAMSIALYHSHSEWMLLETNWSNIHSIGGKR